MRHMKAFIHLALCAVLALLITLALGSVLSEISESFISYGRGVAPRVVDASNLRQIGQASLIFASDNHDHLPDAKDLPDYARQLAIGGGLNDASIWTSSGTNIPGDGKIALGDYGSPLDKRPLNPEFTKLPHLFAVPLNGITANMPATTPIGWTRGLDLETGRWRSDSPYGGEGGHIVFLGGNVSFYRDLTAHGGELRRFTDGASTASLREALPPGTRTSEPTTPSTSPGLIDRIVRWTKSVLPRAPDFIRASIMCLWAVWMLALFPTLTLLLHRSSTPKPSEVPRPLKIALLGAPVLLLTLSVIFRV